MTHVALFHSVYGLRPAVLDAAAMLRADGHDVIAPDLYGGEVADSLEDGFALSARVGWPAIVGRARAALRDRPAGTVLAGLSMGAGVVGELLAADTRGVLLLHGTGGGPGSVRPGLPIQVHVGQADTMFPPAAVAAWHDAVTAAGAAVELFAYPGVAHFFTDPGVADHDEPAATLAWERARRFLKALPSVL